MCREFCREWWLDVVWTRPSRTLPARRIFRGQNPEGSQACDLPVEQPKKFELVINLKTAKLIGLTIPPNVLARANKVIKEVAD